jgi:hypothetical protein
MIFEIAPIVEGHGEVRAVPVLLRRLAPTLVVKRPVRFPRSRLIKREHLERAAIIAAANIERHGAVLLLIDADEDCAARKAQELQEILNRSLPMIPCRVVMPVKEFESWIIGGDSRYQVANPDEAGNLKGRIRDRHGVYSEAADQVRHIAIADLKRLRACSRSFRKLCKIVEEFLHLQQ